MKNKLDISIFSMSFIYVFWLVYVLTKFSNFIRTYEIDLAYITTIYGFISYLLLHFGKKEKDEKTLSNFVGFMRGGFVGYWVLILWLAIKHKDFYGLDLKFGYALSYTAVYEVFQLWWFILITGIVGIVIAKRNFKKKQISKPIAKATPAKVKTELKSLTKSREKTSEKKTQNEEPSERKTQNEEAKRNYNNDLF